MTSNYKCSVIIPTYNMSNTISRAINSVLPQLKNNYELIIVDDGSKDNTKEVIKEIINSNSNISIKYLFQEKQTQANALNYGIKISEGEIIFFLDADDTLTSNSLESRLLFLKEHPKNEVVVANTNYIDRTQKRYSVRIPKSHFNEKEIVNQFLYYPKLPIHPICAGYRKEVFKKIGFFDESFKRSQDQDFIIRVLKNCSVGYLNHSVYNYHIDNDDIFKRIKKRIISTQENFLLANKHCTNDKTLIYLKIILTQSAKLGYEIFSRKK